MRIGVFGGTFNPPHLGHIESSMVAATQLGLDLLIVVPSGIPPHKDLPDGTPPPEKRLQMAREAFKNLQNTHVSDIEISAARRTYTVDTAGKIARDYPGAELFLLLGTDMYLSLDSWKDYETLLKIATPAVFFRNADDKDAIDKYSTALFKQLSVKTKVVKSSIYPISSSELRAMLPRREGVRYINDTTYLYILGNRLYGAKPEWDWLRKQAYSMLDQNRIAHVAGCEEEALRLAERWGVDPDDAREAAILHDITKKLDTASHMKILEEHGEEIGRLEDGEEKLLHQISGSALAKSMFGVSDEVAQAIRWHTTARANMSMLEKIIYIADYIEQNRDNIPDIEVLRAAAYKDINEAVMLGIRMTLRDICSRGIAPNKVAIEALSYLQT